MVTFVFPFEQRDRGAGLACKEHTTSDWHPRLDIEYTAQVPEPTSIALCSLAGIGLLATRRRK
ncbi:PEP-CTERM sorting domain-containing protein [Aeoliella straminimaris]|uniref:PEP-CTERM sorting domain-containing protein n=1 Tax=Aeoliella straminimaris TaxID=2954799 RepID=UPI003CC5DB7F